MPEPTNYTINVELLLASARALGAAFPEFGELVARIEARLMSVRPEWLTVASFEVVSADDIRLRSQNREKD
jgi:hypothetical protein